ncbi:MAG TPA: hypothetical protein VGF13_11935 [Verrucomicrobiae bacterium]|jgi:hypothetical protein
MADEALKRTKGDLMMQLIQELGDVYGKGAMLRNHFEKSVIPQMKVSPAWHEKLSAAEYEKQLGQLKAEIPQILVWLEKKFPEPPANRN